MTSSILRRGRVLAAFAVLLGSVLTATTAHAQELYWNLEQGNSFATFGPNASVTIDYGTYNGGTCGGIFPVVHIYVVSVSSLSDGQAIVDVSNPDGAPNTVFPASGGLFMGETIAFTAPGGRLGAGTYGVVYKRCSDGVFHTSSDAFFYPAFEVVIPANIPNLPNASIDAIKAQANTEGASWQILIDGLDALDKLKKIKAAIECVADPLGCAVGYVAGAIQDYAKAQVMNALGLVDPEEAAKHTVIDTISHYGGIAADPPDPNFQQVTPLGPIARIPDTSDDPIARRIIGIGNAERSESAILAALLHSIERYQGASNAGDGTWALVHARAIQSYSAALSAQLPSTNSALSDLGTTLATDPRDFDALSAAVAPIHAQIVSAGFNAGQMQALSNLGLASQAAAVQAFIASTASLNFTKAGMQSDISALIAENADLTSALATLMTDMTGVITTLTSAPNLPSTRPIADAGGPYAANEGVSFALNGSASTDPGGAITAYAWDLDGDGQFDDSVGATPAASLPSAFDGFVGLQVSDADGYTSVAYAHVTIADVNHAPSIDAFTPASAQQQVLAGANLGFTVTPSDPDGDPVSVRWLVDFVEVGTGSSFTYSPAIAALGAHVVRAEVSDGNPAGGTVAHEWSVSVLAADLDGDGWRANVDCNDANAEINPGHAEVIGNGIDDDCNAATLDGGTPPVAAFSSAPAVGIVGQPVQFSDLSTDLDSPILSWAWTFGDDGTSTSPSPSHTYSTAGTFTVTLTVTDPASHVNTATSSVTVTHAPTAAFTFSPSQPTRTNPVQFTDTSSDADGPIASRAWQFGDGGTSAAQNPSHTYAAVGTYTVTLNVTDGSGVGAVTTQQIVVAPAPSDVASLKFVLAETNCSSGVTYTFSIGGTPVTTLRPNADCTCGPGTKEVTVNDPAVLAQISLPLCQVFSISSNASSYMGWARAEITRPGGVQVVKIFDGTTGYLNSVCLGAPYGSAGARTFNSVLSNIDSDSTPDCADPDIDGDNVLNEADNCPVAANASQADFNSDGIGDACQDSDGDTALDSVDNCPTVANTNQWDFDADGVGNACDDDIDADTILNGADNCPYIANPDQSDADGSGNGDLCDISQVRFVAERTTYGYSTTLRLSINGTQVGTMPYPVVADYNCSPAPTVVTITDPELLALLGTETSCNAFRIVADNNMLMSWAKAELTHRSGSVETVVINDKTGGSFPNSACYVWENALTYQNALPDTDSDGIWNCKDPDLDNDTVLNAADNCPFVQNTNQADVDGNGIGNACQDTDADTVLDINDNCPVVANTNQANIDGDAMGNVCDPDMDNDGVANAADNCSTISNTDQANVDGDGLGDVCDPDMDNDGVANASDNCPVVVNANQRNTDGDAPGDACDPDMDNDGVANGADNCPLIVNPTQAETNSYGIGDACVPTPITVPWHGVPTQSHQVFSGGALTLQGVAVYPGYVPAEITSATWDPGDGTGPQTISVANTSALELQHTYTGAPETPYTAVLTITFASGATRSDTFKVIIKTKTIDVEANMAIDRGLWNLHKRITRTTVGTPAIAAGYWTSPETVSATSSTVQAFEINNHREGGNRLEDPYVDDVARGLAWLETQLSALTIGMQTAGNPDTNGNGIGLQYAGNPIYVTGQVADAFVASGTPDAVAVAGNATWVKGRTYRDLVQDMMDMYWWGQADNNWPTYEFQGWRGGWHYSWNSDADNSTAQWGAITGLAGENVWNIPVPAFVKSENLNHWLKYSQTYNGTNTGYDGSFGYGNRSCAWSNCMSETPSGLVQMDFDGVRNDPSATTDNELRFQAGVRFMARGMRANYHLSDPTWGSHNIYSLYAMAKAFRLATGLDSGGNVIANPVVVLNDDPATPSRAFDWYGSDPTTGGTGPTGVARLLVSRQLAGGDWYGGSGYWPQGDLSTAYAIIILSPTIFQLAPTAVCSAAPTTIAAGGSVDFDGSTSFHNAADQSIASYTWSFQDGSAEATGATASHTFANLGTYNVQLTVADQDGITDSTTCPVSVIEGNLPPTARPGGPYDFCVGSAMVLDATQSTDPDGDPLTFAWDLSAPLNFSSPEGATATFDAASALALLAPGTYQIGLPYQIGLRVSDDNGHSNAVFPNITIHAANEAPFCHVNAAPTFTPPANITTLATSSAGAAVTFTATGTDAEDGSIAAVCTPASGATFAIGETTVSCTVTDAMGATATGSFTVTVTNNPPTFTPPANVTTPATSAAGAAVTFTATGTDVEDGSIPAVCSPASGSTFPITTTTTVNCTVTDSRGAIATGSFTVTVTNNPPTFTPPANITTPATSSAGAAVTFTATGTDLEDGAIPAVCSPASGSTFPITTTTVNCTVTDSRGATASGSFTVTVTSTAAPVNVSGSAYFSHDGYQEKMSINVTVSSGTVQTISGLNYYYTRTRMNLLSTQIQSVVIVGRTATITGVGTVNGVAGYRFINTVTDGTPDAFGITIYRPDGTLFYSYSRNVLGGGLTIQ